MKVVKPSKTLLEGKPYKPSWLMQWKPTLIPHLQGHYGPTGFYRLKEQEGTLSYELRAAQRELDSNESL